MRNEHLVRFFVRSVISICPECEGEGMLWLSDDGKTSQKVLRCEMCNCIGCLLDLPEDYVPPFNKTACSCGTSKKSGGDSIELYNERAESVEPVAAASESGCQWITDRSKQKEVFTGWHCQSCGCRDGVSAALANVDKDLPFGAHRPNHDEFSPDDYCPECYWEKVSDTIPPKHWDVSGRRREGHGAENVRPGFYGPIDDTSPSDENVTRKREGD